MSLLRLGRALALTAGAIGLSQVLACGANNWQPPPPYGQTYQYDYQGFKSSDTTVVAGGGSGGSYAGVFAFRDAKGVHLEAGGKDPFAQATPIDGLRFNQHLQGQGARLSPSSGGPPSTSPAAPSLSASVHVDVKASAPKPQGPLGVVLP